MFTRLQPPVPDISARVSTADPPRTVRSRLPRLLKSGAAVALLGLGSTALLSNATYVTSDNAVVTAHLVSLRAPIEGMVKMRGGAVGESVTAGAILAEIANPLIDDRQIAETGLRLERLRADLAAARRERAALSGMLEDLAERGAKYRAAKVAQLTLESERAGRDRSSKAEDLAQLVRDMRRKVALRGTISEAELEQSETAVRVAAQQIASFDRQIEEADAEVHAAAQGVLIESNNASDIAYSGQRADEVRMRLAALDSGIANLEAAAAEAEGQLAAETGTMRRLHAAVVTVPSPGMIWRLDAAQGERVAPGDLLAQIVDCGAAFLTVAVPQDRVPDLDLGAPASFRLAGEQRERTGHITAITGEAAVRGDPTLAAAPLAGLRSMASVLIAVPPSPNQLGGCLVGRTARVRLPAANSGWMDWVERGSSVVITAIHAR